MRKHIKQMEGKKIISAIAYTAGDDSPCLSLEFEDGSMFEVWPEMVGIMRGLHFKRGATEGRSVFMGRGK